MTRTLSCIPLSLLLFAARGVLSQDLGVGVDLNGGIVTRTDVKEYADLSLDIRDIRLADSKAQIVGIYEEGKHAEIRSELGIDEREFLFPLKKLSTDLADSQLKTPHYLFHLYGLADLSTDPDHYLQNAKYADTFLNDSIHADRPVADAIIALSMWMYATHLLYVGVFSCDMRTLADNPDVISLNGGGMDEFIATWIGTDQTPGSTDGHGLYAWTQRIGDSFGTTSPEATVNTNLKLLYQEGAVALSLNEACTRENTRSAPQLWGTAVQISNQMMVPLYQWLIYSLAESQTEQAELYAKALVPQLSQCRPSVFKRLKEHLLDNPISFASTDEIIKDLQATYSCFGLTCEDIGFYDARPSSGCSDKRVSHPVLAGFSTSSDVKAVSLFCATQPYIQRSQETHKFGFRPCHPFKQLSHIDHDIHQLTTLTSMGSAEFASLIYKYGKHVAKARDSENDPFSLLSLHELAVSADRTRAGDIYNDFLAYHQDDQNYADTAIKSALSGTGKWGRGTNQQRAAVVGLTSAHQIVAMEAIVRLHDAFRACQEADSELGFIAELNPLDEAAALIIGSMEGEEPSESAAYDDGQLVWNLANSLAFEFETLTRDDMARVNSELLDLLYAAKGELEALDCSKLEREAISIEKLLTVGISQAIIDAAIDSEGLPATATDLSVVKGEVYALSILPIIAAGDPLAAAHVEKNMIVDMNGKTVPDGPQSVADRLGFFTTHDLKLSCELLGGTGQIEPCRNHGGRTRSSGERKWPLLALLVSALAAILV